MAALSYGAAFIAHEKRLKAQNDLILSADNFYKDAKYPEAVNLLKTADETNPSLRVKVMLARCYSHMSQAKNDARKLWEEIEKEAPDSPYMSEALLMRANRLYRDEEKSAEAKPIYVSILERYPNTSATDDALFALAQIAMLENDPVLARMNLEALLQRPQSHSRDQAEYILGEMNMAALYSPDADPMSEVYTIKQGDAVAKLARQFKVSEDLITGINKINPSQLRIGQRLKIPKFGTLEMVIDRADCSLKLYNNKVFLKKYRVGLGEQERVAKGRYTVKAKVRPKPVRPAAPSRTARSGQSDSAAPDAGAVTVATATPSPSLSDNPLNPTGAKRIDFNKNDVYIHQAASDNVVGRVSDLAVIAVNSADLDELYSLLNTGVPITVIDSNEKKSEEKKS